MFTRPLAALLAVLLLAAAPTAAGAAAHPGGHARHKQPDLYSLETYTREEPADRSSEASSSEDHPLKPVQVFDVEAGKVVHTLPNDTEYQEMAKRWLLSVKGLSPKVSPDDRCGFVYRVPLAEPYTVRVGEVPITVQDVFLFYCKRTDPVLLVFDPNNKPYLLTFDADLSPFLRKIAAPPHG